MNEEKYWSTGQHILFWSIVAIAVIVLFSSFYTVKAGYRGVELTFGKPNMEEASEGLHFKIPLIQTVKKLSVQTQKYEAPVSSASKDLQIVSTTVAVNYHLDPSQVAEVYQGIGKEYADRIVQPAVQEVVKSVTATFTAEELITKRPEVKALIDEALKIRLGERGLLVETVSLTDFDFSTQFNAAIEAKVTAAQKALKAEQDLERIKIEAQQIEAAAIGQKNADIARAEGANQAKILRAKADAQAIKLIQDELKRSPDYIEYYTLERWTGQLPQVVGGAIPLVNIQ